MPMTDSSLIITRQSAQVNADQRHTTEVMQLTDSYQQ
jgi:hypothetical protein